MEGNNLLSDSDISEESIESISSIENEDENN